MADKAEHSFVADAHNYEQRIKVENEASQVRVVAAVGGYGCGDSPVAVTRSGDLERRDLHLPLTCHTPRFARRI